MMDMTPIQALVQSLRSRFTHKKKGLTVSCVWTVKERRGDEWVTVLQRKNIFTNYGLSALASAIGGGYTAPIYLTIDDSYGTISTTIAAGATSVQVSANPTFTGDNQLVLSSGLSTQEVVTFSSFSGTGPITFSLTAPTLQVHNAGEFVNRQVQVTDTIANIAGAVQYDSVNAPGQWPTQSAGYSSGIGEWTSQFYLTANQAQYVLATVGLTDSNTIGQGNLHNHLVLAYDHTAGINDVEIDVNLTVSNS